MNPDSMFRNRILSVWIEKEKKETWKHEATRALLCNMNILIYVNEFCLAEAYLFPYHLPEMIT